MMPDNEVVIPRMKMSESGTIGLKQVDGRIYEEIKQELRFPTSVRTFKMMSQDATVSSAIKLIEMMISRVKWNVVPPQEADDTDKFRAKFVQQCRDDMDHSWYSFIKEVASVYTYGFSVHEKVYRRRLTSKGSKYNDGLWGIKKLPIRSQDTIREWEFSEDGRNLTGVIQDLRYLTHGTRYNGLDSTEIRIPRNKFLLFRTDVKRDNPEGSSPLVGAYVAYKHRLLLEEQESIGVCRDLGGLPTLKIPPRYMSPDATQEEKDIYEYYKRVIRNIQNNEQGGLILPQAFDPEARLPLFEFELLSVRGTKQYDTNKIIERYDNKILISLFADILKMGTDQVGSYSLASSKTNIVAMAIENRLQEIQDVLNHDLIPQLFKINGWSTEKLPTFEYSDLETIDIDEFSKAVQRMASVGMIEVDRNALNRSREVLGFDVKAEDAEVDRSILSGNSSRGGDGMATAGEGTAKGVGGGDNSVSNVENGG